MLQNALEKHVSMCRPQNEGWIRVRSALASEGAGRVGSGDPTEPPNQTPSVRSFLGTCVSGWTWEQVLSELSCLSSSIKKVRIVTSCNCLCARRGLGMARKPPAAH